MGRTYATVKVYHKNKSRFKELKLLVDTGSTYTWINAETLKELKIVPADTLRFKTIEGKLVRRGVGETVIEYDGKKATTVVVFGLKKDVEVLGLHALEGLALEMHPITQTLKRVEAILAV